MSTRTVTRALVTATLLGGLFSQVLACSTPPAPGPGNDASMPAVDMGVTTMPDAFTTRDAPMRDMSTMPDTGVDTFDLMQTAEDGFTNAFCVCVVGRPMSMTTMAQCVMLNAGDSALNACDELGYRATMGLFDRYGRCRAEALDAARTCIAASDCTVAAVDACQMTLTTATGMTGCGMYLTTAGRDAYTPPFNMCVETMISGPPGACPESLTAVSTIGPSVFSGTTDLAGDDTDAEAACDATVGFAPDRGYLWAAPAAGTYTIDTIGSAFDTILYVRGECLLPTSLACNDDIVPGVMRQSTVEVTLTAGQEVVIIVDGWQNEHGAFVVNITPGSTSDSGVPSPDSGVAVDAGTGADSGVRMDAGVDTGP